MYVWRKVAYVLLYESCEEHTNNVYSNDSADTKICRNDDKWCPRQESNLRHRLRRPVLYPLSYEGVGSEPTDLVGTSR